MSCPYTYTIASRTIRGLLLAASDQVQEQCIGGAQVNALIVHLFIIPKGNTWFLAVLKSNLDDVPS